MANTHHHPAFLLRFALQGVDGFADVGNGDVALQPHLASVSVDLHFGRRETHFPERRYAAQGRAAFATVATPANEFSSRQTKVLGDDLGIRQTTGGTLDAAVT